RGCIHGTRPRLLPPLTFPHQRRASAYSPRRVQCRCVGARPFRRLMATYQLIACKDIPVVIEARDGTETVTRQLSDRFQALIDSVAVQLGLQDSEAYLEQWTRGAVQERPGPAREVAEAIAEELENRFPEFIGRMFGRP